MKISQDTMKILNDFSMINKSIYIEKGKVIKTCSPSGGSPSLRAEIEETFPTSFALPDVKQFLDLSKRFNDPEFKFNEKFVDIEDKKSKASLGYTDPINVKHPPYNKEINLPSRDVEFELLIDEVQNIIKSASILAKDKVSINGNGRNIKIQVYDDNMGNQFDDTYFISVGQTDKIFNVVLKIDDLFHVKGDSIISISFMGLCEFKMDKTTMWVSPLGTSTYG